MVSIHEELQETIRAICNAAGKVNSSCGLHIHVDAANHNRQSLKKSGRSMRCSISSGNGNRSGDYKNSNKGRKESLLRILRSNDS